MAENEKKVDLHDIEPLRPAPDDDVSPTTNLGTADRVGTSTAVTGESASAVGVSAEADRERRIEAEEDLEQLRRG